ncbi:hypothetical protein VY88_22615 [Azospirillum thiophilum]|uniref:Thioredoxin domain-containing protein n=1 Tax=Azospirillum thiophilum TaxID=528244 RepID=A0AAC8W1V8_9PROT|nr:DsbA family protein [Azospirillum thiophilum]ALG73609.1 hypothetical protein AL072_21785 [Azospirillum thiophilum]KJR63359.1 hypothetical protein VY88_22615 [Azospirillum thiophilum]
MTSRFPRPSRLRALLASAVLLMAGVVAHAQPAAAATAVADLGPDDLARGPSAVVAANRDGDVVLIEYFDYQCPVCRRIHPFVKQLAAEDKGVRVIHKHWPVFGAASVYAARMALAARWQDRYEAVHDALMDIHGRLDEEKIRKAAAGAGLDLARAERDLKDRGTEIGAILDDGSAQAEALDLRGTPAFVIGDYLVPGGLDLKTMRTMVAKVRAKRSPGGPG